MGKAIKNGVRILRGLPEGFRKIAAKTYFAAFHYKFETIIGPEKVGVPILACDFNPSHAFVATLQGQFAGLAGFQHGGGKFVDHRVKTFIRRFGVCMGLMRYGLIYMASRRWKPGELLFDGLVVRPGMRGKGIGSKLLEAVFELAREKKCARVRLTVIDTNHGARRLYERMGFVPEKTIHLPFAGRFLGFSALTHMVRPLA